MAKQSSITQDGEITKVLGNSNFTVTLENGMEILCTISGKMRQNFIKVIAGDKVQVEMSPYDLTRGRICRRYK